MKRILVDEREAALDDPRPEVLEVEPGVFSVIREGRGYEARLLPAPEGGYSVEIQGCRFRVELIDPREWTPLSGAALGGGRQNIQAAMPGKVVRVLAAEGDAVEAGQGLVVVEAMKMQNELKAARPGKVVKVHVTAGDTVAAGQSLAVIE